MGIKIVFLAEIPLSMVPNRVTILEYEIWWVCVNWNWLQHNHCCFFLWNIQSSAKKEFYFRVWKYVWQWYCRCRRRYRPTAKSGQCEYKIWLMTKVGGVMWCWNIFTTWRKHHHFVCIKFSPHCHRTIQHKKRVNSKRNKHWKVLSDNVSVCMYISLTMRCYSYIGGFTKVSSSSKNEDNFNKSKSLIFIIHGFVWFLSLSLGLSHPSSLILCQSHCVCDGLCSSGWLNLWQKGNSVYIHLSSVLTDEQWVATIETKQ